MVSFTILAIKPKCKMILLREKNRRLKQCLLAKTS